MSNKETGLMKKTKKELVDIIIRKDDEEIRLKEQIEENKNVMAMQDDAITKIRKSLENANRNVEQHQKGMDEITSQLTAAAEAARKFREKRDSARSWNWVLGIAVVIITALWILL